MGIKAKILIVIIIAVFMNGCGTVSSLKKSDNSDVPDLFAYNKIIVLDFEDGTAETKKLKGEKRAEHKGMLKVAGKNFADRIAMEIEQTKAFEEVLRTSEDDEAIVISGKILKYVNGNAALRFLIGMGAGSSYFDADIRIDDNLEGQEIGMIHVDKNSWVLGGGLAAGQTVDDFMQLAAENIAKQLMKAKGLEPEETAKKRRRR